MSSLLQVLDSDGQADSIAKKLPDGDAFCAKYIDDTNLRKWLIALGQEFIRFESFLNYAHQEMQLANTADLISDFEKEYGMNANCFANEIANTLQARINNILTLILSNGTSTKEQFQELATLLGYDVTVSSSSSTQGAIFPLTFPVTFADPKTDRFIIYVTVNGTAPNSNTFPYTFPITFSDSATNLLECFFKVLKPAHTKIIFNYTS